jgi:tetratricopeptide (TPR) repeat protein
MQRSARAILLAILATTPAALGEEPRPGAAVIGERFPLFIACYHAARDGETNADLCDRSLAEEALSPRRQAIAHANRGVISFNLGDYVRAVSDFTTALDLGINDRSRVLANRGLAYEALRYDALARADYEQALFVNSANEVAARRLEELKKPVYERSAIPRKVTVELGVDQFDG